MKRILLFDIDETILDFKACERIALTASLKDHGVFVTEEILRTYSSINDKMWKLLEKGEITRECLQVERFRELFSVFNITATPDRFADSYMSHLSETAVYMDGARAVLEKLRDRFDLYAVTNGFVRTQSGRIRAAGLNGFFKKIFISEEIGSVKPEIAFFERVASEIPGFRKEDCVLIGDSLTSDIQGGAAFSIQTIWVSGGKPLPLGSVKPTYTIEKIVELPEILTLINE